MILYTCEDNKKQRLDAFIAERADISRAQAKKTIESGLCLVNEKEVKADYKVKRNDIVSYTEDVLKCELEAEAGDLDIIYQDNDYVIINKPPNLTVHPASSQEDGTLVNILLGHFPSMREMEGLRPGIVHRIDKDTSGILVIALHDKARRALSDLFANREVKKEYLALVHNVPQLEQVIELPIGRHETNKTKMAVKKNGKYALTEYNTLLADTSRNFALLAVRIHTGRTHQIRVHLSHTGFPLWGDKAYQARLTKEIPSSLKEIAQRQMLHAWKINFIQPLSGEEIDITCPMPDDMNYCIERLQSKTEKYIVTGNTGVGKSLLINYAKEKGYPTFSADSYVQELYEKDGAGTFLLSRIFGVDILTSTGAIDKDILSELIKDDEKRQRIEKIVHPLVYKAMVNFFEKCEEKAVAKAFAEIPLYFETTSSSVIDSEDNNYKTICVYTDEKIRKERLYARSWSDEKIDFFDSLQLSPKDKKSLANIAIENSSTKEDFYKSVASII